MVADAFRFVRPVAHARRLAYWPWFPSDFASGDKFRLQFKRNMPHTGQKRRMMKVSPKSA